MIKLFSKNFCQEEFYELFNITLKHLKTCFPHLKIGGPAVASLHKKEEGEWLNNFFASLGDVKPDFFSWHVYASNVEKVREKILIARKYLDDNGLTECESILNEWNYVKGWIGDEWIYSLRVEKELKGSAFIASTMLMSQAEPLDNLMFYDARPCGMNSLFRTDLICDRLKGYYPFYMFNQLYKLKNSVEVSYEGESVWAAAAKGDEQNVMLSYFDDNDNTPTKRVRVEFNNVENKNGVRLEYYCLDQEHDAELVREEIFTAENFACYLDMPLYSTYLLKIVPIK